MDYTMNPMTSPIIRYPWSMTGLNNHITVTEETGLTLAMSYMTEILNSQSMKVSSGYETLSFSTYCQKRGTEGTCEVMLLCASSIIWWRHLEKKDWICYSEPIFNLFLPVQCKATYTKNSDSIYTHTEHAIRTLSDPLSPYSNTPNTPWSNFTVP